MRPVQGRHGDRADSGTYGEEGHRMSVWITGDCHGDFHRFTLEGFPQQKGMGRDDYMIICGDYTEKIVIPKILVNFLQ